MLADGMGGAILEALVLLSISELDEAWEASGDDASKDTAESFWEFLS